MSTTITVHSPFAGRVIPLENVPDEAFAEKMVGEGLALLPTGSLVYPPVEGVLEHVFQTLHAFSILHNNAEILVHIGINSLKAKGEGFTRMANFSEGDSVTRTEPLLQVDWEQLSTCLPSIVSPVVITNYDEVQDFTYLVNWGQQVQPSDPIFSFVL